ARMSMPKKAYSFSFWHWKALLTAKYGLMRYTIILIFLLFPYILSAQNLAFKYDLNFEQIEDCNWEWLDNTTCRFERTGQGVKVDYSNFIEGPSREMIWVMSKHIILPLQDYSLLEVELTVKNNSDSAVVFTVVGIDEDEKNSFRETAN